MERDQEYYALLSEFVVSCKNLIDKGYPYLVVILCHELYRFLYPVEPYADFNNVDPVGFSIAQIKRLLELSRNFSTVIVTYPINFIKTDYDRWQSTALEKTTSNLYSELWKGFDNKSLVEESLRLFRNRLPQNAIDNYIVGKDVLDMGCGSGRYSIALARVGAKRTVGVDVQSRSFEAAQEYCQQHQLAAEFREGNVQHLPFDEAEFDFVFCNGVIHHTDSIEKGLMELRRVLKSPGRAFLYLYAAGGIFWTTRNALRQIFKRIPLEYTQAVLTIIGLPSNRFIFCDTWYVPVETHTTQAELEAMLEKVGFRFSKVIGKNPFDLDGAIERSVTDARLMWGDGEHRYILEKD